MGERGELRCSDKVMHICVCCCLLLRAAQVQASRDNHAQATVPSVSTPSVTSYFVHSCLIGAFTTVTLMIKMKETHNKSPLID